ALRHAAATASPSARFVLADMAAGLPFAAACFDAVMANVSIHMFSDALTRALVQDVKRILRPSGIFVFHVNALEDRALRAQRKGPPRELEPNYVLEADGQTMHFFSSGFPVGPKRARPHQEDLKEFSPFSEPISVESSFGIGVVLW